jgi:hypothetical protein
VADGVNRVAETGRRGGTGVPAGGLEQLAGELVVMGDERRPLVTFLGFELDEGVGDRGMGADASFGQLGVVGDFFGEGVPEGVFLLGVGGRLVDELRLDQRAERGVQLGVGQPTDPAGSGAGEN